MDLDKEWNEPNLFRFNDEISLEAMRELDGLFDNIGFEYLESDQTTPVEPEELGEPNTSVLELYKDKHPIEYLQSVIHEKINKSSVGHSVRAFINLFPKGYERNEIEAIVKYKMLPEEHVLIMICGTLGIDYDTIVELYEQNA